MGAANDKQPDTRDDAEIFTVSSAMNFFSWLICEHPGIWKAIGNLESSLLQDVLQQKTIVKPIWVTGLARSGSTLLLEILAGVPGIVSQTYKDFPPVFTPYAWNRLLEHMSTGTAQPAERAHRDGILVTLDSPEAMEEPLWQSYFPDAHNPATSNVLEAGENAPFAKFLGNHIRKLLAVHDDQRYLAKANYQLTRMEYLLDIFPDARFVVPVRDPVAHIASLTKQHQLFTRGQRANARARRHLRRVGHYEFGLDRVPINTGNSAATGEILELWVNGEEVRGWARYWAQLYDFVVARMTASPALAAATRLVHFESLCNQPAQQLAAIFEHCDLRPDSGYLDAAAARIKAPGYYRPDFNPSELDIIATETAATVSRLKLNENY